MKRLLAAALLLTLALSLAACGGGHGTDPVTLGAVLVEKAEALPDMTTVSSESRDAAGAELFPYLSDMDYSLVAGFYLSYSTSGSAEEIALIRVKDPRDLAEARASLERHLSSRSNLFRTYDPGQNAMVEAAHIAASGDTAALFICKNAGELEREFKAALG